MLLLLFNPTNVENNGKPIGSGDYLLPNTSRIPPVSECVSVLIILVMMKRVIMKTVRMMRMFMMNMCDVDGNELKMMVI